MILCTKNRCYLKGNILNVTSCLINVTSAVYRFLYKYIGDSASQVVLMCAKAALSDDKSYEKEIIKIIVDGGLNEKV